MRFYRFTAKIVDDEWPKQYNDRTLYDRKKHDICAYTERFNSQTEGEMYFFLEDINATYLKGGVINGSGTGMDKVLDQYLTGLNMSAGSPKKEEIKLKNLRTMLKHADWGNLIEDDDAPLEVFGIDELLRTFHTCELEEIILKDISSPDTIRSELYKAATKEHLCRDFLLPELDRILMGSRQPRVKGHPVHYLITSPANSTSDTFSKILLQTLYACSRIESRRYWKLRICDPDDIRILASVYSLSEGGAVVIELDFPDRSGDGNYSGGEFAAISRICETVLKYRNSVLSVLILPEKSELVRKELVEGIGATGIVEIKEDLADAERAADYLRALAVKNHMRADKKLLRVIEEGRYYNAEELRAAYDEWHYGKIRTSIYPQYKDIVLCSTKAVEEKPRGSAYDELQRMIGLGEVKDLLIKILNYYKYQKLFASRGASVDRTSMHMVFTGNPGTAKTTVARLFAQIMKDNGLLESGHFIEVGRSDLVEKYVGWTAKNIKNFFERAKGGVLFIDEAYSLVDESGSFGDEAINTIVQEMENRRDDTIVIFAGYPDSMDQFLKKNPGMSSRIAFHVNFSDYDADELCGIADFVAKGKGLRLADDAGEKLKSIFKQAAKDPDFGNGRYVRNVIEKARMAQASRLLSLDYEKVTKDDISTLRAADIEMPVFESHSGRVMGFS